MRIIIVVLVFALIPFFSDFGNGSHQIYAQQEEMMEEGKAPEKAKEAPKTEVKKEEKKAEESKPAVQQTETKKEENPIKPAENQLEEDPFKDDSKKQVPEHLKFYKEKYEMRYDKPFEIVWNAIKKSVSDLPCQIAQENYRATDEGMYKGVIKSDFCVFVAGKEKTFDTLKKYSYELPVIRGGIWENGRMQYTFIVKEEAGGTVYLQIKGEMSGFEEFVTHEVHFWKTNGMFETEMMDRIKQNIEVVLKN